MTEPAFSNFNELLTFNLVGQEYALDIMSVREIRGWTQATPLPHSPKFVLGVINLRGTVLPVMDLAGRMGLERQELNERNVIIVIQHDDITSGLLVDAVSDIISVTGDDLQPPPSTSDTSAPSPVRALTLIDDRMIRVLDLSETVSRVESAVA